MKNYNLNVVVTLQVEGFHRWKDAPEAVAFLRDRHRHMFHVRCIKPVLHEDRDVEILLLKRAVTSHLMLTYGNNSSWCEFGNFSCEQIAIELIDTFGLSECSVTEDGENGALVYSDL